MRVARLKISGFRGIRSADVRFGRHNVLIGPNNVGKTTIIEALALLLGRDRLVRSMTEHDFYGSAPNHSTRILVVATITDFDNDDPARFREWFSPDRGVEKWLDSSTGEVGARRTSTNTALAVQIGFAARFNVDTLEVETARFFVDDDHDLGDPFDEDEHLRPLRGQLLHAIGYYLVPASRTWDRWISFASELFRRVVATTGGMPAEAVRDERERLWRPEVAIERSAGIAQIVNRIDEELSSLVAEAPKLKLRLTTTDSEGLLASIVPHFGPAEGDALPSARHGSGLSSLQSLLLLMQLGAARAQKGESFVLAVEEPELHVQPSQQKRIVNRLNAVCAQTIMTTHSPLVASMFRLDDVVFVRNVNGVLSGSRLSLPSDTAPTNHQQHLVFAWRERLVAALMHAYVLVPEGASDVSWIEALQSAVELQQAWSSNSDAASFGTFIGVAPTADGKVVDTFRLASSVHQEVLCLVDGDQAGELYLSRLADLPIPPRVVFVWPADWAIEHVLGWIIDAGGPEVIAAISGALGVSVKNGSELVDLLQQRKTYAPTQLLVSQLLGATPACCQRVADLLNAMADIARGNPHTAGMFTVEPHASARSMNVARLTI